MTPVLHHKKTPALRKNYRKQTTHETVGAESISAQEFMGRECVRENIQSLSGIELTLGSNPIPAYQSLKYVVAV